MTIWLVLCLCKIPLGDRNRQNIDTRRLLDMACGGGASHQKIERGGVESNRGYPGVHDVVAERLAGSRLTEVARVDGDPSPETSWRMWPRVEQGGLDSLR